MRCQLAEGDHHLIPARSQNKNETEHLEAALSLNAPLAMAYYLKEELACVFDEPTNTAARRSLKDWIRLARASGLSQLQSFANTMEIYTEQIVSWYDFRISSGPMEGTNNKIKTMKRQAYGYRDQEYFTLKVPAIHQSTCRLFG